MLSAENPPIGFGAGKTEKWWIMGRSRDQFGPEGPEVSKAAEWRSPVVRDQAKGRRVAGDPNLKLEATARNR